MKQNSTDIPLSGEPFNPHVQDIDYGVLDSLLGYAVRRAQIVQNSEFLRALEVWNITPPRFSALVIIDRNEGLKLTQLAQVLGIARSGAVMLADALTEMGYVERREVPNDKRAYGLALTPQGRKDLRKIEQVVIEQDQRVAQRLTAAERDKLIKLLDKLASV